MSHPDDPRLTGTPGQLQPAGPRAMVQADGYPGYPSAPMAQDEDVIDLREYWNVLMRRRATIFTVAVIAVIAALIATFTTTPIYRASVLLQIEMESSKVVEFGSVTPEGSGSYWDSSEFYQTQYELLQSRSLAKRVIDQLGLRSSETFAREGRSILYRRPEADARRLAVPRYLDRCLRRRRRRSGPGPRGRVPRQSHRVAGEELPPGDRVVRQSQPRGGGRHRQLGGGELCQHHPRAPLRRRLLCQDLPGGAHRAGTRQPGGLRAAPDRLRPRARDHQPGRQARHPDDPAQGDEQPAGDRGGRAHRRRGGLSAAVQGALGPHHRGARESGDPEAQGAPGRARGRVPGEAQGLQARLSQDATAGAADRGHQAHHRLRNRPPSAAPPVPPTRRGWPRRPSSPPPSTPSSRRSWPCRTAAPTTRP